MTRPAESIVATILGCGSSAGVPRIGDNWGACDPNEPRNRRSRCSLLLTGTRADSAEATQVIIDTGCDLRAQMLAAGVGRVDAVFYTHAHADHTHGIDDLRALALNMQRRVDVYHSAETGERLHEAFGYCFATPPGSDYPPILNSHAVDAGETVTVDGPGGALSLTPFMQAHGDIWSYGYRIGDFAYSCDISDLPPDSLNAVDGLKVWVVDALRYRPHPSHFSLEQALAWIERAKSGQAVLTNLHIDLDYRTLDAETPGNVTPAFDGMRIDVAVGNILNR